MKKRNRNYDTIGFLLILITFMMIMLATNIFFINNKVIIAQAESKLNEYNNEVELTKENFFIHVINKSMSILEINYKENGGKDSGTIIKDFIGKVVDFDYQKPKSLIKAQIPLIKDVESEIVNLNQNEDDDTCEIYIAEEVYINQNPSSKNKNTDGKSYDSNNQYEGDIQVINLALEEETSQDQNGTENNQNQDFTNENEIEIVSTPVPAPKKIEHSMEKPLIFIYHTHGTESYRPEKVGNYHSLNRKYTVIRVGEELKKNLENSGFKVIHDDTIHDHPSFVGSYKRSLETLNKNLKTNSSLKVIFDIHRDGINQVDELEVASYDEIRDKSYTMINGEKVARFSIVIGRDNENIEELKQFAYYIKAFSDEMYPGFAAEKIIIKQSDNFKYRFNQYKSDYYVLFEVGNNTNTIEEAEKSAKYLSRVINQALRKVVINAN